MQRTCPVCETTFETRGQRGRPRVYCSLACSRKAGRDSSTLTCSAPTCKRPVRAKKLCATHYNQQQPNRHKKHRIACETCGETWLSSRKDGRFCSLDCRDAERRRQSIARLLPVGPIEATFCLLPDRHPARQSPMRARLWFAGICAWCDEPFLDNQPLARFCSKACGKTFGKAKRGRFLVPPKRRLAIYERDGWTCQLCFEPVDRDLMTTDPFNDWAPSLDHIECQSWALVPDHSDENLRLAHRWCNAVRGDGSHYTEDDLRISHVA